MLSFCYGISIHAPVWGATSRLDSQHRLCKISIHAPVWGATVTTREVIYIAQFQSTHPCGVRRKPIGLPYQGSKFQSTHPCGVRHRHYQATLQIIIHFNPRTRVGCDRPQMWSFCIWRNFNPRTRVGCDKTAPLTFSMTLLFQSTHPCGVRQSVLSSPQWSDIFQSTHPCGVRLFLLWR